MMRVFSDAFSASISAVSKTLCYAWIIRRTDGDVAGFTDHDQPLQFDSIDFTPISKCTCFHLFRQRIENCVLLIMS